MTSKTRDEGQTQAVRLQVLRTDEGSQEHDGDGDHFREKIRTSAVQRKFPNSQDRNDSVLGWARDHGVGTAGKAGR